MSNPVDKMLFSETKNMGQFICFFKKMACLGKVKSLQADLLVERYLFIWLIFICAAQLFVVSVSF